MTIKIASSEKGTVDDAVHELMGIFGFNNITMIIYFASIKFAPEKISKKMQSVFPGATVFGCSTAGEIVSGKMLKGSLVAMAFDVESMPDVKVEVVEKLSRKVDVHDTFRSFERHFGEAADEMKPSCYLGIILVDGMSGFEERLMDVIGDRTNVLFVGGSSADDLQFRCTHVYANGKSYTNAAVLALLKPATPFDLVKTQSVREIGPELVVTKSNEDRREIIEFNHKPAAIAYAEALGVSVNELAACFPSHPLGLIIEGEPYIRGPKHIAGNSVFFHCSSVKGMPLSLLESTDLLDDTKEALARSKAKLGGISGVIVFNCAHRALELEVKNLSGKYGEVFADFPTIGFNSYGEQFIGHMNQTAIMIVFR
ncbi:MAG: FIST N-terminal domain-containing protein [Geobacteraceae bacterium]|nr:FIST N-terminal domain-containing protein [Geobacteraceae bacterium]